MFSQILPLGQTAVCRASLALVFLALPFAAMAHDEGPSVTTDKDDYLPGEIIFIEGHGFGPGEPIDLSIAIHSPFDDSHIGDFAWGQFNANADGHFAAEYTVPPEAFEMLLTITALGLDTGSIATITVTDHGPSPLTISSMSITADGSSNVTVSATVSGASATSPVQSASAKVNGSDISLTGPGGTGNGVWSTTFAGACETLYELNNATFVWLLFSPSEHGHNHTVGGAGQSVTTDACAPTNNPPVITCLEAEVDLGALTGCLEDGALSATVDVTYDFADGVVTASFDTPGGPTTIDVATIVDPDGDPLVVDVSGPTSVTLIGPGADSTSITVSIEADDGTVQVSDTCNVDVDGQVTYAFSGFLRPLSDDKATKVKRGSGLPVKFQIFDCDGNEICTDLGAGPHTIDVYYNQGASASGDPEVDDAGSANDDGIDFRYSGTCGVDGLWIYNLKTNSTYVANATYKIQVTLNDGTTHDVFISIK